MQKRVFLLLITLLLGIFTTAQAQDAPITAEVSATETSTDEFVILTVTLSGTSALSEPRLPLLDGFQVEGSGRSSQTSIINGVVSTSATYTYRLRPLEAGELVIGPITAVVDGQEAATDPITLSVEQGTLPPGADPGLAQIDEETFFMVASIDNPTPYVGEQVVHTVQAYLRMGMSLQAGFDFPDYPGFWVQDTVESTSLDRRGDIDYRVSQFDTILFPTSVGQRVIGEASVAVAGSSEVDNLHTGTVTVDVQPLPEPAPADFAGAVGELQIESAVSTTQVEVGDSVTLQVILSGFANIDTLPAPELPEIEGWRKFDTQETNQSQVQFGRFGGRRIYRIFFVPEQGGDAIVPPISYTFFNPDTEAYETIATDPIAITVTGSAPVASIGENEPEPVITVEPTAVSAAPEPELGVAIGGLRTVEPNRLLLAEGETAVLPIVQRQWYWLLWLLPLLLLAGDFVWANKHRLRRTIPPHKIAFATAQKKLEESQQNGVDPHEGSEQALLGYLHDKLGRSVSGLTNSQRAKLLQDEGIEDSLIAEVDSILELTTISRFAPAPSNGAQSKLLEQTGHLLERLDEKFAAVDEAADLDA